MSLYERQSALNLNTDISITCIGCGGIGYWVAKFAAMSGVPTIYLFDPDTIEDSNLNRLDIPNKFIGRNKADVTKLVIKTLRPTCIVEARPYKYQDFNAVCTDWIVDCTDNYQSQLDNQKIARSMGSNYVKAGYNGFSMSINDVVAEWGEAEDGYTITPSWVVPASIVASLTVAKIIKYENKEMGCNVEDLFLQ